MYQVCLDICPLKVSVRPSGCVRRTEYGSPVQSAGEAGHEQLRQSFSLGKQAMDLGIFFNR